MRRLCFGGSFNPIHHGHLICARAAAEAAGFDTVLLIPSGQPPHKPSDAGLACPADRLEMCRLAISVQSGLFEVDDIEMLHPGPSYTIDTVRRLRQRGWDQIHWLIGADMLMLLPKWHCPLDLLAEVQFVVMARPGWTMDWSKLPADYRHLEKHLVTTPAIDISASEIRRRVAAGLPIDYLTPAPVVDYIRAHGLYRA